MWLLHTEQPKGLLLPPPGERMGPRPRYQRGCAGYRAAQMGETSLNPEA